MIKIYIHKEFDINEYHEYTYYLFDFKIFTRLL